MRHGDNGVVRRALIECIIENWDMGWRGFRPTYLEEVCHEHPLSGLRILRYLAAEYREWACNNAKGYVDAYPDPRLQDVGGWYKFTPGFVRWLRKEKKKLTK